MGLYDYIRCEFPLPHPSMQDRWFQTKDLGQGMNEYHITKDGVLKAGPDKDEDFKGWTVDPMDTTNFHGDIDIYDFAFPDPSDESADSAEKILKYDNLVVYRIRFTNGKVTDVRLTEGTPRELMESGT